MLLVDNGIIKIKGSGPILLAELACLINHLIYDENCKIPKAIVEKTIEQALKPSEEIHDAAENARRNMVDKILRCSECPDKDNCTEETKRAEREELEKVLTKLEHEVVSEILNKMGKGSDDDLFTKMFGDML